ncbi:helix-turn-helix domain-containing protein [Amycolatopsis magusensis]|uniref:helix-turn-helix domain-containing protein n=1 Tax=Amycolatopsis magusensis TaxID=882444 RepID=UPI0037936FCA
MTVAQADAGELLDQGVQALAELLDEWRVVTVHDDPVDRGGDTLIEVQPPNADPVLRFLAELSTEVTPRFVETVLRSKQRLLQRTQAEMSLLVITPHLSVRTRNSLREARIDYVDLTGNISVRSSRPAVVLYTEGGRHRPRFAPSGTGSLAGAKAGRLVRMLVDHAPPYRAKQLADRAGLSLPYVSRLLTLLEEQLLVRREGRVLTEVDWAGLVRARAEAFGLLRHNAPLPMLAPNGLGPVLEKLAASKARAVVTGSHAARELAPVAIGGQLMLYVPGTGEELGDELGLLPVDEGADVVLLRAGDEVVFERPRVRGGLNFVASSQVAIDCLSGPGRMPAEGEAVVAWMARDESKWRLPRLPLETGTASGVESS